MAISEYVKKGIARSNGLTEVMERRQNEKLQELDNLKIEAMIAEEKKKLQEASPPKTDSSQAGIIAATLFAGRKPEEIKQILSTLTPEEIDRLAQIASSGNQSNLRGLLQPQNSSLKETLEIVKLFMAIQPPQRPESNGISGKDLIDAIKTGMEISKAQQPVATAPQENVQFKLVESTLAELKASREEYARQEKLRLEREIEALKNRPSGFDEILYNEEKLSKVRKMFGGDSGAANEFTLKKTEMEQTKDLENKKLDWEMKKWELEKEKEGSTLETVKEILEGPAGEILKSFGSAGAERLRGGSKASASNSQAPPSQLVKVKCPNCAGDFPANPQLAIIQCPLCGRQLQHSNQPAPSAPSQVMPKDQPPSDSAQAQHPQNPVDHTVEDDSPVEQIATQQ